NSFDISVIDKILSSVAQESEGSRQVLVSSEGLSRIFLDATKLHAFAEVVRRYFSPKIILYIRRQDELKESVFGEIVKRKFVGSIDTESFYKYNHLDRIRLIWKEFPKGDVIIRAYDRRFWTNNRIEDDFMDVLGISNISSFEPVDDVNPRLHRRLLLFL